MTTWKKRAVQFDRRPQKRLQRSNAFEKEWLEKSRERRGKANEEVDREFEKVTSMEREVGRRVAPKAG